MRMSDIAGLPQCRSFSYKVSYRKKFWRWCVIQNKYVYLPLETP